MKNFYTAILLVLLTTSVGWAQEHLKGDSIYIMTQARINRYLQRPAALEGWWSNQKGPLTRINPDNSEVTDSTFTVENIQVPSGEVMINGWLYLPLGHERVPLIVLTNGGGDDSRPIKSLSDWLAPILAHCGYAAFVHDKRGTGASGGEFTKTTYEDYINDAGQCGIFLSGHPRIDTTRIGVCGGSEGGRIAVVAASRFPVFSFVISDAGTMVSAVDDRINAQKGWFLAQNLDEDTLKIAMEMQERSIRAWASGDSILLARVDSEIVEMRKIYGSDVMPFTKAELDSVRELRSLTSTWYSLSFDYLSEMAHFKKKWLAIYGAEDQVVPTTASVNNIQHYMKLSGNQNYLIAVLPDCGHTPVNTKTQRLVRIDYMTVNWLNEYVSHEKESLIQSLITKEKLNDRCLLIRFGSDAVTAISTGEGIVVIDAGISTQLTRRYRRIIEEEFPGQKFLYVINTHAHHDHMRGNNVFAEAAIIGQVNGLQEIAEQWKNPEKVSASIEKVVAEYQQAMQLGEEGSPDWLKDFCQEVGYHAALDDALKHIPAKPPDSCFTDSLYLLPGGLSMELCWFGMAHSSSDVLIFIPEMKLLFSGDLFSRYGRPSMDEDKVKMNDQRLRAIAWLNMRLDHIETVITGHGQKLGREDLTGFCEKVTK